MQVEEWKDIKGYEGRYQISSLGRVKSLPKDIKNPNGIFKSKEKILKPNNVNGYYKVQLYENNIRKSFFIHRLVAEAFIKNINNYSEVNHKDENKQNNKVENLEWCTSLYNANYGTRNEKCIPKLKRWDKKVICINTGECFESIKKASEKYNLDSSSISKCCRGKLKTVGGYKWKYIE